MIRTITSLAALAALGIAPAAHAALDVTSAGQVLTQNFDTLASSGLTNTWANDSTLAGWSLFQSPATAVTGYRADNGGGNSTTGSFYSFGATGSSERALGGVGSGTFNAAGDAYIALQITNNTGGALSGFTIGFAGEQWRNGGNANLAAQTMVLQYGFGSSFASVAWNTPGGSFDWTSPVNSATAGAVDGNAAGRVNGVGGSVAVNWAAGQTLWFRWIEKNDPGNDHGLAIDDVVFTAGAAVPPAAVPLPAAAWLLAPGLLALGSRVRRRQAG